VTAPSRATNGHERERGDVDDERIGGGLLNRRKGSGWLNAAMEIAARNAASHIAWRTCSPISASRRAPYRCAIVGVTASSTPVSPTKRLK
jgi:hypothetical protein